MPTNKELEKRIEELKKFVKEQKEPIPYYPYTPAPYIPTYPQPSPMLPQGIICPLCGSYYYGTHICWTYPGNWRNATWCGNTINETNSKITTFN